MLLRRVIEHVKAQNWTAIVIEFVLLVAGVFLGIQVANWNGALADQRQARDYVTRLTYDLELDLASRRELVAYYGAVMQSIERADALLADPQSDPKELVIAAYRASEVNFNPSARATWDEIVSSGDIGLLSSGSARYIAEYYAFDTVRDTYNILVQSAYRHRVRTLIPLSLQKAMRAGCSDKRDQAQRITGFMQDCRLDIAPDMIADTAAALRHDAIVKESLRYQYSDMFSALANIRGDLAAIEMALAQLKASKAGMGSAR